MTPRDTFAVTFVGREECAPDYSLVCAGFHYYAVECVMSGWVALTWDGIVHILKWGSVFGDPPNSRFSLRAVEAKCPVKYFLDLLGRDAAALLEASGLVLNGGV
jgi:hypothetical protein